MLFPPNHGLEFLLKTVIYLRVNADHLLATIGYQAATVSDYLRNNGRATTGFTIES